MRNRAALLLLGVGALAGSACSVYDESLLTAAGDGAASHPEPDPTDNADAEVTVVEAGDDVVLPEPDAGLPLDPPGAEPEPERPDAGSVVTTRDAGAEESAACVGSCGPTCTDGIMNGTEMGVDCGGSCPAKCGVGSKCTTGATCQTGYCKSQVCANDTALRFLGAQAFSFPRPVADDFTLEFWVKTTQVAPGTLWFDGVWLLQADVTTNANDFGTSLLNGKFAFGTGNPDFNVISTSVINTGQWTHVAATRVMATGMLSVFVNGVLEKAAASSNTGSLTGSIDARVGCTSIPCNHAYIGEIDEIRVWKVVHSAAQIAATMKTRLLGTEPGLVGYWRLDEGSGKTFEDSSPSKGNGTWTGTDDPVFTLSGVPLGVSP